MEITLTETQAISTNYLVSKPVIDIKNVNHYFGKGALKKQVLFDVSLEIYPGEIVLMTGPSGSGKTTLLTMIGGLRSPIEGSLKILGKELVGAGKNRLVEVRRNIGYIFQAHNLLKSLTARQNVLMSLELHPGISNKEANAKAKAMLEAVGLGQRIDYYPENLSGGQKQRVAIARAIVNRPVVLLADEPTGALDSKTTQEVMDIFTELNASGITVVMVTHEPDVARQTKRIVWFRDGEVLHSHLTPDEIGHVAV